MRVTFFKDAYAKSKEERDVDLDTLQQLILATEAPSKKQLPWLKLASFGNKKSKKGILRHDANVRTISGVELDYDDETYSYDSAVARLRALNLGALIYTSPSHTSGAPRWRLLLPTSKELPPKERVKLARQVNTAFGNIFAPESFALSQSYFYGHVHGNADHRCQVISGKCVDQHPTLDAESPFTADVLPFKQPIDCAARLDAMTPRGEGDTGVHNTQLAVSAALLNQGMSVDDVVDLILEATKKAAHGEEWDWEEEEEIILGMCTDWIRKHPQDGPAKVVNLDERRAPPSKAKLHMYIGGQILAKLKADGGQILYTAEILWRYRDGLWSRMSEGDAKAWLNAHCEEECAILKIPSTVKLVNEVRAWIYRSPTVYREEVKWDAHKKIPTKSGLLDPGTLAVEPLVPEHFATYRIESEYQPKAKCPWFLRMMGDVFRDRDPGVIQTIQELIGVAMLEEKPRSLMRALVLVGPSNSGKSNVLAIASGFLCAEANATTFETLENSHGLVSFLKRVPWVLHEAFEQSKWHFSSTVKSLLSGDPVNVNIKNGPMVTLKYRSPVFWGTNNPPQFKEASKAMISRMIVLECRNVFEGPLSGASEEGWKKGYSSAAEFILAEERAGLLNWALQGMSRAVQRGSLLEIEEVKRVLDQIRTDSNMVAGFISDCVEFDEKSMVSTADFCGAFSVWWGQMEGEGRGIPSNKTIGRAVSSYGDSRIVPLRSNSQGYYCGIKLNPVGLDYWSGLAMSTVAAHKIAQLSVSAAEVNKPVLVTLRSCKKSTGSEVPKSFFSHKASRLDKKKPTGKGLSD